MCKGTLQDGFSNFTADLDMCIIIIKNVPAYVCNQCGEVSYNDETAKRIEEIVQGIKNPIKTEIAVVNYSSKAA